MYTDYSPTTNLDQILQERVRDQRGKAAYKQDDTGNIVWAKEKKVFLCLMCGKSPF